MDISLFCSDVPIGDAALYAFVGFLIVVGVLALLVGIFYLSGAIFSSKLFERKKQEEKKEPVVQEESDDEIVAAITAAIAVMLEEERGDDDIRPDFVIRRITRN